VRKTVLAVILLSLSPLLLAQQSLNNDAVIKLVKAGLSEDLIVSTINAQAGTYDTSPDGLIALKAAGVTDKVVATIVGKAAASVPTPGPSPAASGAQQNNNGPPIAAPGQTAPGAETSATTEMPEPGTASGSRPITPGVRVVIAPMGGFETYFAAAVREKKVPITLTLEKASAQYFVVSTNTEWQGFVFGSGGGANWNRAGGNASYGSAGGSTRGLEASIMLIDAKTKDVVWAYEVHKSSHGALLFGTFGARGQQSIAEACAKHLKEYIEKGK
jgi:TolB-like protein